MKARLVTALFVGAGLVLGCGPKQEYNSTEPVATPPVATPKPRGKVNKPAPVPKSVSTKPLDI